MSRAAHKLLSASGSKDAYEIEQSLMFDRGSNSQLYRTPSSAGNLKTFTISFWLKRTDLGYNNSNLEIIYSGANGSSGTSDYGIIYFDSSDRLGFYHGSTTIALTSRYFSDISAWYHIYIKYDSTQGTASNRSAIYVNGVQETSFNQQNQPSQNTDSAFTNAVTLTLGSVATSSSYPFGGYLADFYLIDGTVKPVTDFGETDSDTGQWIPKEYTGGSYGTNGFYLKFVSGAIGTDSSGQSNNYTATNLANSDIYLDTPNNNFAVHNSEGSSSATSFTVGNLWGKATGNSFSKIISTIAPTSGKWYCEYYVKGTQHNGSVIGTSTRAEGAVRDTSNQSGTALNDETTWLLQHNTSANQRIYRSSNVEQENLGNVSVGDVLSIAMDVDNSKVYFRKNNTIVGSSSGHTINTVEGGNRYFFTFHPIFSYHF